MVTAVGIGIGLYLLAGMALFTLAIADDELYASFAALSRGQAYLHLLRFIALWPVYVRRRSL